jgi:hypothetical protein
LIRRQIEEGFEVIGAVDDEIRGIVARNWPHLLAKLPPEEDIDVARKPARHRRQLGHLSCGQESGMGREVEANARLSQRQPTNSKVTRAS